MPELGALTERRRPERRNRRSARVLCRMAIAAAIAFLLRLPQTTAEDVTPPESPATSRPTSQPVAEPAREGTGRADDIAILFEGEDLLRRVQTAITSLVRQVEPCVVTIQADRNPTGPGQRDDWAPRAWMSTGAGVIIRDDGMVLTSQHVIDKATRINVVLHDGRAVRAIPIAEDRRADLAVIRIQSEKLRAAELAEDDSAQRGNIVVAMGNPLGLSGDGQAAVSHGIISAIGRPLPENFGRDEDRYYGDMIQTTAPINPGNSGGPLIDVRGRVIGIITAVSTRSDGHDGIGFAVPINRHTRAIIQKLLRGQQVEYGYLGVEVEPIDDRRRAVAALPAGEGVIITTVFPGGPAERAGVRGGDVVASVNGEAIKSVEHFVRTIGSLGPNHVVGLSYVRDGKQRTAKVTLVRRPSADPKPLPDVLISFRGAELGTVPQGTRLIANLPDNALLVLRVESDSPADRSGLTPGDIIVRIDGQLLSEQTIAALNDDGRDVLLGMGNGGSVVVGGRRSRPSK